MLAAHFLSVPPDGNGLHYRHVAYRLKRPLRWNPVTEKFKNDAEANRLLSRPMRKEWSA